MDRKGEREVRLSRRRLLALAGGAATLMACGVTMGAASGAGRRKPNIIVILADDLGYADLGCQGCKDVATPNIDSLAKGGVRFTDGYVSCPVCSPTRAGLLTGRYQTRFGLEFNPGPVRAAPANFGLPLSEKTIADWLKAEGYATGIVGKWHLGYKPPYVPTKRGFDEFFGFLGGSHRYFSASGKSADPIRRGMEPVEESQYLTDAFTREAVAFIERHSPGPFFLYLPYNAVHMPLQATADRLQRYAGIGDKKRRTFAAMLAALDEGVGAVLTKLRDLGLERDTLIFFLSDNGGPTRHNTSRNDPLRGYKGQVLEGGIRVPFLAQWKGRLPAGKVYCYPVSSLDILPTAVAAAGGTVPRDVRLDGVNLLPYLTGDKKRPPHDMLFWRFGNQYAVRAGKWKLVKQGNRPVRLFDLASDVGEKNDLAAKMPEKVKELEAAYASWNAKNIDPLWKPRRRRRRRR